ncbi:OLC1v1039163C3 [Oldenlandia corymbosa var. corymbosa]|uniref:OLC1v1039163C3 n=1 Tax=Oldenlandia corymbosa var. corymbosa TaxID=529605 RepID=A0AAV1D1H8_OLDCO|nr:OLC1v1039163C3 [Oldenlandia corymbosa var. corymbosa]
MSDFCRKLDTADSFSLELLEKTDKLSTSWPSNHFSPLVELGIWDFDKTSYQSILWLTARDEKRGLDALHQLQEIGGLSDSEDVIYHQLDVADPSSIVSLAEFIKAQFGRLDILVNNAGIIGTNNDAYTAAAEELASGTEWEKIDWNKIIVAETYELAVDCLRTNYYGSKRMIEAFTPTSPIISITQNCQCFIKNGANIPSEWAKWMLGDDKFIIEERVDEVVNKFMQDFKEGSLESQGWPLSYSAYIVSKAANNAYTRIVAKKLPDMKVNCVCPGYVQTDLNNNTGMQTAEKGAEKIMKLVMLPDDGPSGLFFARWELLHLGIGIICCNHDYCNASFFAPRENVRFAVVTGANKGIGFEVVRQLASQGITVVLTARDEKRGLDAVHKLKESGDLSGDVIFHQLDVADSSSVASLAEFVKAQFGRLDILVNNAGIIGVKTSHEGYSAAAAQAATGTEWEKINWNEMIDSQTYEMAVNCLQTNYYGDKRMIEAFTPLLELSKSPRVVNVSSVTGLLKYISNEWAKGTLSDEKHLTEERVDEVVNEFLQDFEAGSLEAKGWPLFFGAYIVSKAAINAYTKVAARKQPSMKINCLCPGYVKTDINYNTGFITAEEAAEKELSGADRDKENDAFTAAKAAGMVKFAAKSGVMFFSFQSYQPFAVVTGSNKGLGFEIVRQLASHGITVVLTARDEKRGLEAVQKLKESDGFSDGILLFHQLDVSDSSSVASLAEFIKNKFGRLDILVNNAGIIGASADSDIAQAAAAQAASGTEWDNINWNEMNIPQTYELAVNCLQTNYYGAKRMVEAFMPLLQLSPSPRIVNVSSEYGLLKYTKSMSQRREWIRW